MRLLSWFRERITGRSRTRRAPARKPAVGFRPRLETLEGRIVPSFSSPVVLPSPNTVAMISGDLNGDGRPDLIFANNYGDLINVRLNDGNGGFGTGTSYAGAWPQLGAATALAVGTYKGNASIFVARYAAGNGTGGNLNFSVLQLQSNGHMTDVADWGQFNPPGLNGPMSSLSVADLYGTGESDLVAASANGGRMFVERINSAGSFGSLLSYSIPGSIPFYGRVQLAVTDINGDGRPDVVATDPRGSSVSVLLNTNGTFATGVNYAVGGRPGSVAVGDVNGDGKPDVVTANSNGTVSVLSGLGSGTFGPSQSYAIGGPASSVALGDFNHDGKLDIATTGGTETDVLLNNGDGTFSAYRKAGPASGGVIAADFNDDGYADLAEILGATGIDVYLNDKK